MPKVLVRFGRSVERLVGSDVHPGEWHFVLLFFANLFLLLTAYYVLKVIREPLILMSGGAVSRSYARGLQAGLLFAVIPAYSWLANRIEPARLVKWIYGSFVICLAGFYAAGRLGLPVGFAFFVWLGIFSTLSIAQFWSLANDIMTESEGKRLFPLIAAGGTVGGIAGAQIAARASEWLHPYQLMLLAAALLAICMALTHMSHGAGLGHRERVPDGPAGGRDTRGGFALLLGDRYLMMIALAVLLLNLVNTTGDFILAQMVNAKAAALAPAERSHFIGAFYGDFQTWVSALTAVIQIVVVARVFKKVGVGGALLFLPVLAAGGYGLTVVAPVLAIVATVKVVENSTDYSLQNTIQQALFLPTSRDAKYKAKSAIDTLSVRLGDLLSTALVFLGTGLALSRVGFAVANVVAALAWVWVAVQLKRQHRALIAAKDAAPVVVSAAPPPGAPPPSAPNHQRVELVPDAVNRV
jgi:AAA family ATP:ADP antiporter